MKEWARPELVTLDVSVTAFDLTKSGNDGALTDKGLEILGPIIGS